MDYLSDISSALEPKIIAEIGINHGGSLERAKYLSTLAIESGAHIVKTQIHIPSAEMSTSAKSLVPSHCTQSIFSIMEDCSLSLDEELLLKEYIEDLGGEYLSTPFSIQAASFLQEYADVKCFKIGSGECNNLPLLLHVASYNKPVILSTGMNDLLTAKKSYDFLLSSGCPKVYLLHTTNLYPTPENLVRLGAIKELQSISSIDSVGLSDHTTSNTACLGAVALGAVLLERHFIDSKQRIGPDIQNSMTPSELCELRNLSKSMFIMRGGTKSELLAEEEDTRNFAFATVVLTQDLPAGTILNRSHLVAKRPRSGDFDAASINTLVGKTINIDLAKDTHLLDSHIS